MSNTVNPVQSNDGFTKVENLTGQLSELSAADGNVSTFSVGSLTVGGAGLLRKTIVGYTPLATATATLAVGGHALLTGPNLADATVSTDARIVTVPAGATILETRFHDAGSTFVQAGGDFDLNVGTFQATGAGGLGVTAGTAAIANAGSGGILKLANTGATGAPTAAVGASPANILNIDVNTAVVTGGYLCVEVDYVMAVL